MIPPTRPLAGVTTAVALAAGLLAAKPAVAQQPGDTIRLDEIVVTATRLPLPRAAVASAVTVIGGDELRRRGIADLLEALRGMPGATLVQGGSFGAPASLFLRGGESDYVRVLVDGVPVNAPGGAFDFAHLSTANVERIEVVRGPSSVLYGSDAVAGVVQVFTRSGHGAPRWRLAAGGGTWASSRLTAEASAGGDRAGFSVAASRFESAGTYPSNSGYWKREISALLRAAPDSRTEARLSARVDDHRTHFPTDGAGRIVDRNQFTTGRQAVAGLDLRRILGPRLEARMLLGATTADLGYDDAADGPADTLGMFAFASRSRETRRSVDARAIAHLAPGTSVTLGGTLEREAERSRDTSDGQWGRSSGEFAALRRNAALYAQAVADAGGRFAFNAGLRLDRNERFGSFATYRAGVSWRPAPAVRARAAAGSALKEPTFFENFATGYVTGNPDLRPERSRSWEIGGDLAFGRGRVTLAVTLFAQRFAELIQYTFAPPAAGAPNYFNVAAARAAGFETEFTLRLGAGFTTEGRYTYLSTSVLDAGFDTGPDAAYVEGRRLLRRPAHAAGAVLTYARGAAALAVSVDVVGARDDMDYGVETVVARVRLPAHARVDASASLPLLGRPAAPGLAATLRIENLLGARYEEVRGFPARGRTILVGLRAEGGLP
jgi:vitamin B12 transporter